MTTSLPERNLDLLRATGVICVVADHTVQRLVTSDVRLPIVGVTGTFGVMLLFVHTALVLMGSIERQGSGRGSRWVIAFFVRRALRIYPLAVIAVLAFLLIDDPSAGQALSRGQVMSFPLFGRATVLSNLALAQNLAARPSMIGPMWTLPIELEMYLLFPLCFIAAHRGWKALAMLAVAFEICYLLVAHPVVPTIARLTVFAYAPCFLGGVVAYALLRRGARATLPTWSLIVPLLVAWAWLDVTLLREHRPLTWLTPLIVGAALPFFAEMGRSWLTRAAHTIATYSYGIYLWHVPILWLTVAKMTSQSIALRVAIAIGTMILLPWAGYRFIEKPGIDLGHRMANRLMRRGTEDGVAGEVSSVVQRRDARVF